MRDLVFQDSRAYFWPSFGIFNLLSFEKLKYGKVCSLFLDSCVGQLTGGMYNY